MVNWSMGSHVDPAPSADEARSHLAGLPLVKAGLIDFKVMPLVPYSGFARLFSQRP